METHVVTDAPLSTVTNAARLLKAFLTREESIGVSELSRRLGIGKSNVHRLLTTLAGEGLVEQDPRTGGDRPPVVVYEPGGAGHIHLHPPPPPPPPPGPPPGGAGRGAPGGVLDGAEVVYVGRLESAYSLRLFTETGRRVPAHAASSGKVLLAFLSGRERDRVLDAGLPGYAPHTVTDPDLLRAELAGVRAQGWARSVDEREIGVTSVAAPIRDVHGDVVAAVSIGAPSARLGAVARRRYARLLVEAGEAVSRRLGWVPEGERRAVAPVH